MRVLFFGSGAFGLPTLQHLCSHHDVAAIVSQPDRPAGRKRKLTPTPISLWAQDNAPETELIRSDNVNELQTLAQLKAFECDAWVVIAFGQKLSEPLLRDEFAVNLHASLLPRWRGAAPINHAILAGDSETGNSVITLADRMDAGLVLGQSTRTIEPQFTTGELHDRLAADGPPLIERVLSAHLSGTLRMVEQDESEVTIAGKLQKSDGWIDFSQRSDTCRNRIHGLNPWPSVTVEFRGEPLKLLRAKSMVTPLELLKGSPGTLIEESGLIACGEETALQLLEVQPPGKPPMSWQAFAQGRHPRKEERFIGHESC